jgi:hypothetical protein
LQLQDIIRFSRYFFTFAALKSLVCSPMLKWLFFIVMLCWELVPGVAGSALFANRTSEQNAVSETAWHDSAKEMKFVISEQTQCLPDGKIESGITLVKRASERVTVQVCKSMVYLSKKTWRAPARAVARSKAFVPKVYALCNTDYYIFFLHRIIA